MKAKFILGAISALACAGAHAQSSVTISGYVDGSVILESGGAAGSVRKVGSGVSGPSRLIFRGVEDLGGGNNAFFHLETGVLVDTGASLQQNFFGRQAFVGMGGSWGSVRLGLQYVPVFTTLNSVGDPFRTSQAGGAGSIFTVGHAAGPRAVGFPNLNAVSGASSAGAISRANTVAYFTPNMGGFSGEVAYSVGEVASNSSALRTIGAGAGYAKGPLNLRLAYSDTRNAAGTASEKNWVAASNYDFGMAKLYLTLGGNEKYNGDESTDWLIGASVPVGPGELRASYVRKNDKSLTNSDPRQIAVGYIYRLSKRTQLHVSYAHIKNNVPNTAGAAFYTVGTPAGPGTGNKALAFGIGHFF